MVGRVLQSARDQITPHARLVDNYSQITGGFGTKVVYKFTDPKTGRVQSIGISIAEMERVNRDQKVGEGVKYVETSLDLSVGKTYGIKASG